MLNFNFLRALTIFALLMPIFASVAQETRSYLRTGVFNPGLNRNFDLHYDLIELDGKFTMRVKEQELMNSCSTGTTKMEKVPDLEAHIFIADTYFGCPAYGIGFSLDYKKGWLLSPSKTTGKYPTGAFLMKWVEEGNRIPAFVLVEK